MCKLWFLSLFLFFVGLQVAVCAESDAVRPCPADTAVNVRADASVARKSLIRRVVDYFAYSNKNPHNHKFDVSFIGGPHYDTDSKLGLGIVAAGLYDTDRTDSLLQPSNVSLKADVTTAGFYTLGLCGLHLFPHGKFRLDYDIRCSYIKGKFWGTGYDMGNTDSNESDMTQWEVDAEVDFLFRLTDRLYAGPMVKYEYADAKSMERPELLGGAATAAGNFGLGVVLVYDSRDVITNPRKGLYVNVGQSYSPSFMGSGQAFATTDVRFDAYLSAWRGAVIATDLCGLFHFGNPSWGIMSRLGGSHSMRGYYKGRYRDRHKIEAQVELRQHLWRRNGVVLWAGAGTVFDKFSAIRCGRILPNCGLGYRWEFKKDMNVRFDYGFGKNGQHGFMFSINEAF